MALNIETKYPTQSVAGNTSYPYGSAQNVTVSGDGTGTPWTKDLINDWFGFFQRLLVEASITPSGASDTVLASDYFDALDALLSVSASATVAGIVELATDAETQEGTDATKAVTPAGLSARTATETRTGVIELATSTEVNTGTDTARAVTPAGLSARTATETRTGLIELATEAEAVAGTDTARAVTPAGLSASLSATQAGTWQAMTLLNGHTATRARYRLINGGANLQVDLYEVDANAATATTMYLFPAGYRPANGYIQYTSNYVVSDVNITVADSLERRSGTAIEITKNFIIPMD